MNDNLFRGSAENDLQEFDDSKSPSLIARHWGKSLIVVLLLAGILAAVMSSPSQLTASRVRNPPAPSSATRPSLATPDSQSASKHVVYQPRHDIDTSGFGLLTTKLKPWAPDAGLDEIAESWREPGLAAIKEIEQQIQSGKLPTSETVRLGLFKAACWNFEGQPAQAYKELDRIRSRLEADEILAEEWLYSVIFFQGVCGMRRGEDENCIMCRGESSCIVPISPSAVHVNPAGSRTAIKHFVEYLERFPDDLEVKWLLNLAYMTLGEYPAHVPPEYLCSMEGWSKPEFDIGVFRDVGHLTGLNRFNNSGGAILEDFDNDGHLDVVVTSWYPSVSMAYYRNAGNGKFEDQSELAGVLRQTGGLNCVQTDYNNDGWMDIYIPRGAWVAYPMRPTLLRNEGQGRFKDVTAEAGLLDPVNSISASWSDYDNDGWLDLFVCCERQANRLYRNRGNGTFESVAERLGVQGIEGANCKGVAWIDYDNDDYPDLYLNNLSEVGGQLYHNNRGESFTNVNQSLGIVGPEVGFSCWTFDYNNDGWLDIFATCYDSELRDIVVGIMGKSPARASNKLFRNEQGKRFQDVTEQTGIDKFFDTMGSNFGDFDNDGFLDMYLGTGDPVLSTLVPNRMFKNVAGERFSEITASARTGNLQKGHGVGCGDWDHDGDVDIFIQMGGAIPGDKYHNILFQNPGQGNHWLSVKLIGQKSNRAAIGARVKAVTDSNPPLVVHELVSSGSSFGANPLQRHLGLGQATRVATLEIHWPTSGTTQVFHDIPADQCLEITEFATEYKKVDRQPIPLPTE